MTAPSSMVALRLEVGYLADTFDGSFAQTAVVASANMHYHFRLSGLTMRRST